MCSLMYEEIRGCLKVFLENAVKNAITYCVHDKRFVIKHADVVNAFERMGSEHPEEYDCAIVCNFSLPRLAFKQLVGERVDDYDLGFKILVEEDANAMLQKGAEKYLVGLLEGALTCATASNRKTVVPKDMMLALREQ